jgi:maltose-binding protein MalE
MKYMKLKTELKQLASEIREKKNLRKKCPNGYVPGLDQARWDARHKHIAYGLLRGKPYEKIEQPRKDNKPVMGLVEAYIKEAVKELLTASEFVEKFEVALEKKKQSIPHIIADIKACRAA